MLLTISTTHQPATDLGYLLHKNPARLQTVDIAYGQAHVFYPEATAERCTAALLLDIDPIALVRNHRGPAGEGFALEQYVNDRPYAASSLLAVALADVFSTARSGRCAARQSLAESVEAFERDLLQDALKTSRGSCARAARMLGTTERIFNYKIRKYGVDVRRFKA